MYFKRISLALLVLAAFLSAARGCMTSGDSGSGGGETPAPTGATGGTEKTGQTGDTTPFTTQPTTGGQDNCKGVFCQFGKGSPCSWTADDKGSKKFTPKKERLGNRDTGVPGPASGSEGYMGTEVNPGETAILSSGPVSFGDKQQSLLVKYYEATDGLSVKACSNDVNTCQPISNPGIKTADKAWATNTYPIPSGTNKLFIVAENKGNNKGAVGIDSVNLVDGNVAPGSGGGSGTCS